MKTDGHSKCCHHIEITIIFYRHDFEKNISSYSIPMLKILYRLARWLVASLASLSIDQVLGWARRASTLFVAQRTFCLNHEFLLAPHYVAYLPITFGHDPSLATAVSCRPRSSGHHPCQVPSPLPSPEVSEIGEISYSSSATQLWTTSD